MFDYFICFISRCFPLTIHNEKIVPGGRLPENIFYLIDSMKEMTKAAFPLPIPHLPPSPIPFHASFKTLNDAIKKVNPGMGRLTGAFPFPILGSCDGKEKREKACVRK